MIYKIVLTGGPCSGKSTCLEMITKRLEEVGYKVITVPETAREIIQNITIPRPDDYEFSLIFQEAILKLQLTKEMIAESFAKICSLEKDVVILYDRSVLDNPVYLPYLKDFNTMLQKHNEKYFNLAQKYDLVIDLVTVASKFEHEYINDGVRLENNEVAIQLDKRTTNAYLSCRNLKIVPPTQDIQEKVDLAMSHIIDLINEKNNHYDDIFQPEINLDDYNKQSCELGDENCVSRYFVCRKNAYIDGVFYSLIKKQQNDNCVFELESFGAINKKYKSQIITHHEYLEKLPYFIKEKDVKYEEITFVKDYELFKIKKFETGRITVQKMNNEHIKENVLVKK